MRYIYFKLSAPWLYRCHEHYIWPLVEYLSTKSRSQPIHGTWEIFRFLWIYNVVVFPIVTNINIVHKILAANSLFLFIFITFNVLLESYSTLQKTIIASGSWGSQTPLSLIQFLLFHALDFSLPSFLMFFNTYPYETLLFLLYVW